jgi:hypothetical protein
MTENTFIWISRWREFQHYKPDPSRGPAWIKSHTSQLSDDRYLNLTARQRALLHDLRHMFATFRLRLGYDKRMITRQRNAQTFHTDIEALVDAGLLELVSRATLEQRLEELYSRPRAEVEVEKRREEPTPTLPVDVTDSDIAKAVRNGTLIAVKDINSL